MNLFELAGVKSDEKAAPLAQRLRPKTIDEVVGQKHLVGADKFLNRIIMADKVPSMIFTGPPGTGKTTIAELIANVTSKRFERLSAVTSGVKDIREVVERAEKARLFDSAETIVFIDEIHRFNKSQQDALLPHVENGLLILIGATTENPYFEVNKALISRTIIVPLYPLEEEDLRSLAMRAVDFYSKDVPAKTVVLDEDALEYLVGVSAGDARFLLNGFELAVLSTREQDGIYRISAEDIKNSVMVKNLRYDKSSDSHYDTISAFIKSMRGSDPDASVYYLAAMIEAGEDPKFIARRMIIFASEDISNADPRALELAVACFNAVNVIGMPEARIILSQTACYLATAPKSNASYLAIGSALKEIKAHGRKEIPMHLRNAVYEQEKNFGKGVGYKYPHDYENAYVEETYLPQELSGTIYYRPNIRGYENTIIKLMSERKKN